MFLVEEDQIWEYLSKHKAMGPGGMHLQALRK